MAGKRAINADVPVAEPPAERPPPERKASAAARRAPIPTALKAIGGLVLVAIVFLLAAILGGGGANRPPEGTAPAPAQPAPENPPADAETPTAEAAAELGYPSFATNNTTRVGGTDPAGVAAAVSLAVFPSTTPAQRPAAVTLVDEDDWQGAVAASVLMAAPLRAPLLVTTGDELPDVTEQALAALDPQGSGASGRADGGRAQAFAIGAAASPADLRGTRVRGKGPAALAAGILGLRDGLLGPPRHIVLVSDSQPEFAVPAAAWAARSGDPVLFTGAGKLPRATIEQLERHPRTPVFVLGPSSAVSSDVVREVAAHGGRVRRVSGEDPVGNAIALARYASGSFGWNVNDPGHGFVVARSDAPLAAAVAAPLSASGTWGPLLLTDDAATVPPALRDYLLDVKPGYTTDPTRAFYNHVWVIGDQEAIEVKQQATIDELAELTRVGGES